MGSQVKLPSAKFRARVSPGLVRSLPQLHRTHAHRGRALHQGHPPGQQTSAPLSSAPSWNLALTPSLADAFHSPPSFCMHVPGFTEDVMKAPHACKASGGWQLISTVHGLQPDMVQSQEQKTAPQDSETGSPVDELSAIPAARLQQLWKPVWSRTLTSCVPSADVYLSLWQLCKPSVQHNFLDTYRASDLTNLPLCPAEPSYSYSHWHLSVAI